jgi:hypothetical protein
MAFDATIRHWKTITEFAAYLQTVPRPKWCTGLTNHNTYEPSDLNWRGTKSMDAMMAFYRDTKKWPSGPHLFLAAKAPNAADTGIFQMTTLTRPGTHAGACNTSRVGIESVGDFDRAPPSADQYTLLIAINLLILHAWGLPPSAVNVHRDCIPGRTCPGKYLTSEQIRADLSKPPPPITKRYRVKRIMVSQRPEGGLPYAGELQPGEEVVVDKWYAAHHTVHLADHRGFVLLDDLEAI